MASTREESSANLNINEEYTKIDKMLSEIPKKHQKTIDFHILNYFKKNVYESINKKTMKKNLLSDYHLNKNKFINSKKVNFSSEKSLLDEFKSTLENGQFQIFNKDNDLYIKIDPEKVLEHLTFVKKQIWKKNNVLKDIKKKRNNCENSGKDTGKIYQALNHKTKRQKSENENNKKEIYKKKKFEINQENNPNNNSKSGSQNKSQKNDSEEYTSTEKIYNNFSFYQSNFSKLTFNDKMLSNNSAPFSNNSIIFNSNNFESVERPSSQKDSKEELLYVSKDEEEAFKNISNGIRLLEPKLNEINSYIICKQKKLEIISSLLLEMNQNLESYKKTKSEFNDKVTEIKICVKGIDDQSKIFKNSGNMIDLPFKEEVYKSHIKLMKNIAKKSGDLFEDNKAIINKLNNYDIAFTSAKVIVESDIKEIIEGDYEYKDENDCIESLKNFVKFNLDEAFKKLNVENQCDNSSRSDNNNDMKNIYDKNEKIKSELANSNDKVIYCEKMI